MTLQRECPVPRESTRGKGIQSIVTTKQQGYGGGRRKVVSREPRHFGVRNKRYKVLFPEHLIHQRTDAMHMLIANPHQDGAGFRPQISRHGQPVAQLVSAGVRMTQWTRGSRVWYDLKRMAA